MIKSRITRQERVAEARIYRAQLTLFLEKLWPALLPALGMVALFLLLTLFELWQFLPWIAHYAVLAALVGIGAFLLIRDLKDLEWPRRGEALDRLEKDGKIPHAALRAREDRPFSQTDEDSPLWRAHLSRMEQLSSKARLDKAKATADRLDPWNLRYGALLLLVVGTFIAWGDFTPRFWNAVSPRPAGSIPATVDLWIDPPAYTGRAPVILVQSKANPEGSQPGIAVPQGSTLHARINGADRRGPGRARLIVETDNIGRASTDLSRSETTLTGEASLSENAAITLTVNGRKASWPVVVAPDQTPKINFAEDPLATEEGRVRLVVELDDDYGITESFAVMSLDPDQDRPLDTPAITADRATDEEIVPVSGLTGAYGVRSAELTLTDHPWAGLDVNIRILGKDGAGQEATTETVSVTLPERDFYNPLARAIIHERRNLAVAPDSWTQTSRSLDALTFAPDRFFDRPTEYLLLRAAYWGVINGRGENVSDLIEEFWPLALQLEDQALELARRALAAAQQALREALERGASQSEIQRLVENLRTAMQNYIQALAESGQSMASRQGESQELEARDLDDILNSINELSDSGANNAARQLLSELEQMLQNLQITQGGSGSQSGQQQAGGQQQGDGSGEGGQQGAGGETAQRTGDLIGRQRDLADETFEAQRQQFDPEGTGSGAQSAAQLQQQQEELGSAVDDLLEDLDNATAESGNGTGEDIARSFREARERMAEAAEALESGNLGAAGAFQQDALDALREGADGISDQIMQAQQGDEEGEDGQSTRGGRNGAQAQVDPLGRPYGAPAPSTDIGIPDLSDPERARELILELRRKLSEPGRTEEEIDYLERLLERF
ncbi:TIGR02302 family protein [Parvularcula flava]|nr:TIGR02302 family protein [Aquisalinus luteolus]NHK26758.1 TIGR02302 family protein [Aquisalinus luteolus]